MTTREFLTAVIADTNNEEISVKAQELISALDAKNEKRKSADSKEKKEVLARKQAVLSVLSADAPLSRDEIAVQCGVTPGQATSALTALVKDGLAVKSEVKVDKSKRMVYSLAE